MAYYKLENKKAHIGNVSHGSGWVYYTVGQEPQELLDAIAYKTPEELEAVKQATTQKELSEITVETPQGNVFDGDDVARLDMLCAIVTSDTRGRPNAPWKLANGKWKDVGVDEIKEALALAIEKKGQILSKEI